jgi:hypothetical protein
LIVGAKSLGVPVDAASRIVNTFESSVLSARRASEGLVRS